jgi:simple sugar transport system permease protein
MKGMKETIVEPRALPPIAKPRGFLRILRKWSMQIAILFVAIIIWAFFLWRAPSTFLRYDIYNSLMTTTPFFALMAIPLTLVIIAKEIDLSFPAIMAWGMAAYDVVFTLTGNVWLGFFACLLAGLIAGWLNGAIVVKLGIPSLVATLGTQFFWRGVVLVVTNGQGAGGQSWRRPCPVPVDDRIRRGHLVLPEPSPLWRARLPDRR